MVDGELVEGAWKVQEGTLWFTMGQESGSAAINGDKLIPLSGVELAPK